MSEVLKDDYQFVRGEMASYPYDEWLDGAVRRLRRGEDFSASIAALRSSVQQTARKRGGRCKTRTEGDDAIVIKFVRDGAS
jgi:hypothetical protein